MGWPACLSLLGAIMAFVAMTEGAAHTTTGVECHEAASVEGESSASTRPTPAFLPCFNDLPIPSEAQVQDFWPDQLKELADFVGPYHALRIVDRLGGRQVRIPTERVEGSVFRQALPREVADELTQAYAGCEMELPVARSALDYARRQPLIAAVRAGKITVRTAAIILGSARTYVSQLVNRTDEGVGHEPIVLPEPGRLTALRQAAEMAAHWLTEAGATEAQIDEAREGIVGLFTEPTN